MDTKLKNVKTSLGFRALCIVLSLVLMASSALLAGEVLRVALLYDTPEVLWDTEFLQKKDMADTDVFSREFTMDIWAINTLASRKENAAVIKQLQAQQQAQIDEQIAKYNKHKAKIIRDCLIHYAKLENVESIDYDALPTYIVPSEELESVVPYNKKSPALIRDLQQIVNGTPAGADFLQYEALAKKLPDTVHFYETEDYLLSDHGEDLNFSVKIGQKTYSDDSQYPDDSQYYDCSLSEKEVRESLTKRYTDFLKNCRITNDMVDYAEEILKNNRSVHYYAINKETGEEVSNLQKDASVADLASASIYYTQRKGKDKLRDHDPISWNFDSTYYELYAYSFSFVDSMNMSDNVELTACVIPVKPDDDTNEAEDKDGYYRIEQLTQQVHNENTVAKTVAAGVLLLLSIAFLIIGVLFCGRHQAYDGVKLAWVDKIPTDLHTVLSGGCITGLVILITLWLDSIYSYPISALLSYFHWYLAAGVALVTAIWAIYMELTYSFVRICKSEKHLYKNCLIFMLLALIFKVLRWIFRSIHRSGKRIIRAMQYTPKHFRRNMFWTLFFYTLINVGLVLLFIVFIEGPILSVPSALLFVAFNGYCLWYALHFLHQLDEVIDAASERRAPNLPMEKLHPALRALTDSLRYTNDELKAAVTKAVRDERLKTELITNVSHDLKTPLTSIITYVDLLSKCEIEDEKAQEYIRVLNDKSGKLKRLIEDLIEASKVSTGNIVLHSMPLNLGELAAQAVGESQNDFEKNHLSLLLDENSARTTVFADGSKTFRIIENLLSNARKYSAPGSRVYVRVYEEGETGVFEIKNISAEPLNISPDELTERFVRGDASRTREGNGLGLSIAKELCTAQQGRLQLMIDGDLFKARVYLPKTGE